MVTFLNTLNSVRNNVARLAEFEFFHDGDYDALNLNVQCVGFNDTSKWCNGLEETEHPVPSSFPYKQLWKP